MKRRCLMWCCPGRTRIVSCATYGCEGVPGVCAISLFECCGVGWDIVLHTLSPAPQELPISSPRAGEQAFREPMPSRRPLARYRLQTIGFERFRVRALAACLLAAAQVVSAAGG